MKERLTCQYAEVLWHGVFATFVELSLLLAFFFAMLGCGDVTSSILNQQSSISLKGIVTGVQQPISYSTLQLYAAGSGGEESPAQALFAQPFLTDENGRFTITGSVICPSPSSLVYIVATGGKMKTYVGKPNSSIALMAALGPCANLDSQGSITVDELTTIGSIWPLAPYIKSYTQIGSNSVSGQAFEAPMETVDKLVSVANGIAPGPMLALDEIAPALKIQTLASILAACVESSGGSAGDGSACGQLFSVTTPKIGPVPQDTFAAALAIAHAPLENVREIYDLLPATNPFQTVLSSAPSDWTLPILSAPAMPTISPATGTLSPEQAVFITEGTSDAAIFYTTDGSLPTAGSQQYSGPFVLPSSANVRAVAIKAGISSSGASKYFTVTKAVSLVLMPGSVTLSSVGTQQFTAAVIGSSNTSVSWTLSPAVGSISAAGLYTAPASITTSQTVTVTATSKADSSKTASASVGLQPTVGVSVVPGSVTLSSAGTQQFTAAVIGSSNTSVSWTLSPAVGSISAAGLYTAPASITTSQTVTVTATSKADSSKTASAIIAPAAPATAVLTVGTPEQAQSAARFMDSVGVNTHITYTDTEYGNTSLIATELQRLGVTHVRDGYMSYSYPITQKLGAAGIRFGLNVGNPPYTSAKFQTALTANNINGTEYIEAWEGSNELDVNDPNWVTDWNPYFAQLKGANIQGTPIWGPPLAFASNASQLTPVQANYGTLHPYSAGQNPSVLYPSQANLIHPLFPGDLLIASETGYHNALNDHTDQPAIDYATGAKYLPRLLLESFNSGVYRTYLYELFDEESTWNKALQDSNNSNEQCHWGMIDANGVEKPAFIAIRNLLSILKTGNAEVGSPTSLSYTLTGGSNINHLLLQKSPYVFELILWQNVSSWNTITQTGIVNPTQLVGLQVNAALVATYLPSASTISTSQILTGQSVSLNVPDEALVVEITLAH